MSKYLRLETEEMDYLKNKAVEWDSEMVFKTPNDVLRAILDLGEKQRKTPGKKPPKSQGRRKQKTKPIKIRVDDDVRKKLDAYADKYKMKGSPIDKLLEHVGRLEYGEEYKLIGGCLPKRRATRAGGRPATR